MFKGLLFSAILLLSSIQIVKSQQSSYIRNPKLGIGLVAALGGEQYGYGYFLNFQSPIAPNLNWTVIIEKTHLESTVKVLPKPVYKNIVAKVGAKYFLGKQFYVSGEIGAAFDQIQRNNTRFAWSPGIGFEIKAFGTSYFDIGGKYESYQAANPLQYFAMKFALNLGL